MRAYKGREVRELGREEGRGTERRENRGMEGRKWRQRKGRKEEETREKGRRKSRDRKCAEIQYGKVCTWWQESNTDTPFVYFRPPTVLGLVILSNGSTPHSPLSCCWLIISS